MLPTIPKKFLVGVVSLSLAFSLTGCVYLVIGGFGALGGYMISPDTVEGILTDKEQDEVWDAAIDVVSIMGIITERSEPGGVIVAKIQNANVRVTIFQMSKSTVRLTVKARKNFFPKSRIAQEVYVKIVNGLTE
jgi:hypothetical protein